MTEINGVTIVICCHNSAKRLPPTLEHLKKQIVPAGIPWEVIVVDNASTDETSQIALTLWSDYSDAPLRVVSEPRVGLMNARISGFREANYEFVSFVDDDNWVCEDWVVNVYKIMREHPEIGACGGRSEAVFDIEPPDWYHQYHGSIAVGEQSKEEGDVTASRGWLWGAGLTIRKTAWEEIRNKKTVFLLSGRNGLKLSSGEDNEICYALRILGWRLYYSPQLSLKHFISANRISWEYLCKIQSDNGYTLIVMSRYHKFFKNKFPENCFKYIRHWLGTLYSLLKLLKESKNNNGAINQLGSREYLNHLQLSGKVIEWLRLGPYGVYKIDRGIQRWKS